MIPLISVFAAFSFVIMMFNLPLPGGTTGHAVGVGIGRIVLGPWASMSAISIALVIQAVFFGDGGITAIGANCFNMAIVGSLVAYGVYRSMLGAAPIDSPRRVAAAAVAGICAINVAALFAAIEFGIQPLLFHDATGAPLYAPYPLQHRHPRHDDRPPDYCRSGRAVISSGVWHGCRRSDPSLLRLTAPDAPDFEIRSLRETMRALADCVEALARAGVLLS